MATWMKKDGTVRRTIYHSYLKNKGRITIRFTQESRESDYEGNPPYCKFQVAEDPEVYSLQIASDSVEAAINAVPLDSWLECEASGDDREGTAAISLKPAQGVVQETLAPQRGQAPAKKAAAAQYAKDPYPWPDLAYAYRDAMATAMDVLQSIHGFDPTGKNATMSEKDYAELVREYAASMLYRQESMWKSTGKWIPLQGEALPPKDYTEPEPQERATIAALGELSNLYQQVEDHLEEGPEKTAIQQVIGKGADVTAGAAEKCLAYLRGVAAELVPEKKEDLSEFTADALAGDDDLPF